MAVLAHKAAVVTGGGRGIGRGHCLQLVKNGASVIINDIDEEAAQSVADEIAELGGNAVVNTSNISTQQGANEAVQLCVDSFGGIDIMVANAGFARDKSFLKMTEEDFDAVMDVHVKGTFHCLQQSGLRMRDQGRGGSMITTVSAGHFGNFGQANYGAAKGAIASMTYTLAIELAKYGIRVNGISPLASTRLSDTYRGDDGKEVELPYFNPELNGTFIAFLCSDEGNYISGQIFGSGGERITLLNQPKYGTTMFMPGGWTIESMNKHFKDYLGSQLEPLGIFKTPYPFYDGIKPPQK